MRRRRKRKFFCCHSNMLGSEPLLWSKVVLGMLMHTRSKRNPIVALLRQGSIYWEGASPPKKVLLKNNLQLFQIKIFFMAILRNQWRLLMSRNAISANPEHYIFKIFRGSMPPDPPERPKKIFFSPSRGSKAFFKIDSPPKQKILDRTLWGVENNNCVSD